MRVLFLDIDGVLNGHEWGDEAQSCNIRRECVKHLNRVVRETGCRIVLSSAWRYMVHGGAMTLQGFGYMLRTHGLIAHCGHSKLIVGLTRKDDESVDPLDLKPDERARQIKDWLEWWADDAQMRAAVGLEPVSAFAAVDDEDHRFAGHGIPHVITDGSRGLTDADADRLIATLLGKAGATVAKKPKRAPVKIELNGHTLHITIEPTGERRFACASWPDLAERYDGTKDPVPAIEEFERRALGKGDEAKGAA